MCYAHTTVKTKKHFAYKVSVATVTLWPSQTETSFTLFTPVLVKLLEKVINY